MEPATQTTFRRVVLTGKPAGFHQKRIPGQPLSLRNRSTGRIDACCFNCFIDPALFKAINTLFCNLRFVRKDQRSFRASSAAVIASVSLPTRRISQRGAGAGGASAHHRRAEPQGHAMSHTSSEQRIREVQGADRYRRYVTGESNTTAPPKKYKTRLFKSSALFHIENALFYFCTCFHLPKCVALVVDIVQMAFQGHRLSHLGLHLNASELHRAAGVPSFSFAEVIFKNIHIYL